MDKLYYPPSILFLLACKFCTVKQERSNLYNETFISIERRLNSGHSTGISCPFITMRHLEIRIDSCYREPWLKNEVIFYTWWLLQKMSISWLKPLSLIPNFRLELLTTSVKLKLFLYHVIEVKRLFQVFSFGRLITHASRNGRSLCTFNYFLFFQMLRLNRND